MLLAVGEAREACDTGNAAQILRCTSSRQGPGGGGQKRLALVDDGEPIMPPRYPGRSIDDRLDKFRPATSRYQEMAADRDADS